MLDRIIQEFDSISSRNLLLINAEIRNIFALLNVGLTVQKTKL